MLMVIKIVCGNATFCKHISRVVTTDLCMNLGKDLCEEVFSDLPPGNIWKLLVDRSSSVSADILVQHFLLE
ncbi:hypothetical protein DY000_02049063 [Brassica cretica]|uniref:DUF4371 domain-containing protein n=1 Tax=Brassica cretica TaxID=69181 RepID=A0ABQ7F8D8_BRACR|nr:hypothetical protein DY000_02049063 [Brassica cretica]